MQPLENVKEEYTNTSGSMTNLLLFSKDITRISVQKRLLFQIAWLLSSSGRVGGPGREQTEGEAEVNCVFTSPAWSFSSVSSWSCICKEICQDKASQRQPPIKINYTTLGFSSKLHCSTTNSAAKKIMNKRVYKDTKLIKQMSV